MARPSRRTPLGSAVADEARAAEHGVLSREVAAADRATRRRLRSGVWRAYGSVVVTHNGPLEEVQRAWVAVLRAGPGAVLAAAWAMREHGVSVVVPERPQVVVPAVRSWPRIPDVDVRRSRLLGPEHVHPVRQPPVFRLARATLDATSLCRHPEDVRALLCAPVQQRRLRPRELRECLALLGPLDRSIRRPEDARRPRARCPEHPRAALRAWPASAAAPGTRPPAPLPAPGGKAYLDCWWERYRLHVEIDGLAHLWVTNWLADLARSNELAIGTPATRLRFAGFQLIEQEDEVFDQVRRALVAGGWTG
jgi:hypothetical protein